MDITASEDIEVISYYSTDQKRYEGYNIFGLGLIVWLISILMLIMIDSNFEIITIPPLN
jgi:hypothetical protein